VSEPTRLAAYFAEVSKDLASTPDEPVTFERVVRRAIEVVPAVDFCGITMRGRRGRPKTVGSTHEVVVQADRLQYDFGEGPCLDAAFEHENCVIEDLASEQRWPTWAAAAHELGIGSMMGVRLHTNTETFGALNLYAAKPWAFDPDNADIALIYSAHAAEAMSKARLVTGLQTALESRHMIGVAQGVLMGRYDIDMDTAFEVLRRYSNDHNVKLRDVAQQVVGAGELPSEPAEVVADSAAEPGTVED
jgi:hypothetical protein